jgi:imidazolonepropionase-like amidohydrolase
VLDGHTTVEHNIPQSILYKDVINLWSNSSTSYTPTLIVCYGAFSGENYWYQKTDVWTKTRQLTYMPRSILDSRSRHRVMIPDAEYENGFIEVARSAKKLSDAGVRVCVGAHGQLNALGYHWEMWNLSKGGMKPMEVLRCATINPAYTLGLDKDLGSLEKGKLADLVVLDKNPLDDIMNTESVHYTMVNGRLFDAETLNEIGNYDRKRGKFWWENAAFNQKFPWHESTNSFMEDNCGGID